MLYQYITVIIQYIQLILFHGILLFSVQPKTDSTTSAPTTPAPTTTTYSTTGSPSTTHDATTSSPRGKLIS